MATHTDSGSNEFGRKFSIKRENGQVDKNSRPYFFEWVKQIPSDPGKRKFVTRKNEAGEDRHYELFAVLDGYLISIEKYSQNFGGTKKEEDWLKMILIDASEEYHIEVGRLDSRYSMDIMKRLLDPNFDPNKKLRLAPISSEPKGDNNGGLFISAYSGVDKLEARYECKHLEGMPQRERFDIPGKDPIWSYINAANWLYERITRHVAPALMKDPISSPQTHTPQAEYKAAPAAQSTHVSDQTPLDELAEMQTDDLPF